jgi:uncharacterized membrane protein
MADIRVQRSGFQKADDGGRRVGERGQISDDRGQKTVDRRQQAADGGQKNIELKMRKPSCASRRR